MLQENFLKQRDYMHAENMAYAALKKAGFIPSGYDNKTGLAIVLKKAEGRKGKVLETYAFEDWQNARRILLCKTVV